MSIDKVISFEYFNLMQMREKEEKRKTEIEEEMKLWDPHNDPNATGDAFKTLFVARIVSLITSNLFSSFINFLKIQFLHLFKFNDFIFQNYDTSEAKLRREFEKYGKIKKVT